MFMDYPSPEEGAAFMFSCIWKHLTEHLLVQPVTKPSKRHLQKSHHEAFQMSRCGVFVKRESYTKQLSAHVLQGENESGAECLLKGRVIPNNSQSMSYKVRVSHLRVLVEKESLANASLIMSYMVRMSQCGVIVKRMGYAKQLSEHVLQGKNESFESACRKRVFAKQLSEHVLHGENESVRSDC